MALFRGDVRSSVMQMDTGLTVILPYDRPVKNQQEPCKVLYLLHGMKLNTTGWQRFTNLENFTKENIQKIAYALTKVFKSEDIVPIGYDNRFMGKEFAKWISEVEDEIRSILMF